MHRLFLLTILPFCFILSGCFDKKNDNEIIVGLSSDYPPFEFQKNGEIIGLDVDFATQIADKMGKKLLIQDMPLYSLISALQNGKIDLIISGISPTKERQNFVSFSEIYHKSKMAFLFNSQKISPSAIGDFQDKIIGAQTGSTMEVYLNTQQEIHNVTVLSQDGNNQLVEYLKIGKIDAILLDLDQAIAFSKVSDDFMYFPFDISDEYGFAVAVQSGDDKLLQSINAIIQEMRSDGSMKILSDKWLTDTAINNVIDEKNPESTISDEEATEHNM